MRILIHADDLGLSEEVTDAIFQTHDCGVLASASVMINGDDVARAVRAARERPALSLRLHLSLTEGAAAASPPDVPLLVNEKGRLCHSFVSLWARYIFALPKTRRALRDQVGRELSAQIESYLSRTGGKHSLCVDSHHHSHMIPFVFQALLELHDIHNLSYVRIPREKFFYSGRAAQPWKTYFGSNVLKHFLLNSLAKRSAAKAARRGIATCDYFVGVLFTGRMTLGVCKDAIASIRASAPEDVMVEILFHPGRVVSDRTSGQPNRGDLADVAAGRREKETAELLRPEFKALMALLSGRTASQLAVTDR